MLSAYRVLFSEPGARPLVAAGLIARAPRAMVGIGIVAMVSQRTGEYALAGALCGTYTLSSAVAGPWVARAVDRFGQRIAARAALPVSLAALAGLVVGSLTAAPLWALFFCSAGGGVFPNVGGMTRARWIALYGDDPELHTALSMESVCDEITFIAGPILALSLSVDVFPEAGVVGAMLLGTMGTWAVTAQRRTEPAPVRCAAVRSRPALWDPALSMLVLAFVASGAIFSSIEVGAVDFAAQQGDRAMASYAMACFGVTSCLAGVLVGAVKPRSAPAPRLVVGFVLLAGCLTPLPFVHTLPEMALVFLAAGLFISPTVITANALVKQIVPSARLNEGLTWLLSGTSVGLSLGSVTGGMAADRLGPQHAFFVPVAYGVTTVVISLCGLRLLCAAGRGEQDAEPLTCLDAARAGPEQPCESG